MASPIQTRYERFLDRYLRNLNRCEMIRVGAHTTKRQMRRKWREEKFPAEFERFVAMLSPKEIERQGGIESMRTKALNTLRASGYLAW